MSGWERKVFDERKNDNGITEQCLDTTTRSLEIKKDESPGVYNQSATQTHTLRKQARRQEKEGTGNKATIVNNAGGACA